MKRRLIGLGILTASIAGCSSWAQQQQKPPLCDLLVPNIGTGAIPPPPPPSQTVRDILASVSSPTGLDFSRMRVLPTADPRLLQGAQADLCGSEQWIFYSPDWIDRVVATGKSKWTKNFIFAHEAAHHLNNNILALDPQQEFKADRAAAMWLTLMNVSVQELVGSINAFVTNEAPVYGYPSRCERVNAVIDAYNSAATLNGANKPLYESGHCMITATGGLHAAQDIPARIVLQATDLQDAGAPASSTSVPLDFSRDVAGMCTVTALRLGDQLTWDNIGVCDLMHEHRPIKSLQEE